MQIWVSSVLVNHIIHTITYQKYCLFVLYTSELYGIAFQVSYFSIEAAWWRWVAFVDLPNAVRAYAGSNGGEFSLCNYVMRVVR